MTQVGVVAWKWSAQIVDWFNICLQLIDSNTLTAIVSMLCTFGEAKLHPKAHWLVGNSVFVHSCKHVD